MSEPFREANTARHEGPSQQQSQHSDRRTVTVIRNDCSEKMMSDAARKACIALDCSNMTDPDRKQDLATSLKASFDSDYEGTWNAVVGSDFGASITHELSRIIFFAIEEEPLQEGQSIYVLLFQQTENMQEEAPEGADEAAAGFQLRNVERGTQQQSALSDPVTGYSSQQARRLNSQQQQQQQEQHRQQQGFQAHQLQQAAQEPEQILYQYQQPQRPGDGRVTTSTTSGGAGGIPREKQYEGERGV